MHGDKDVFKGLQFVRCVAVLRTVTCLAVVNARLGKLPGEKDHVEMEWLLVCKENRCSYRDPGNPISGMQWVPLYRTSRPGGPSAGSKDPACPAVHYCSPEVTSRE